MSTPGYSWRHLSPKQREDILAWRQENARPWHSPPHRPNYGKVHFLISGACYEHAPYIGLSLQRLDNFSKALLELLPQHHAETIAWCVLPNHYHLLVETSDILALLHELGQFHGRTSYAWNGEENLRGRQVFHRVTERYLRSERHFWATLNYVHNNPVHHGYVRLWTEWPWSSATEYLEQMGRVEAERVWKEYPTRDYGQKWDPAGI